MNDKDELKDFIAVCTKTIFHIMVKVIKTVVVVLMIISALVVEIFSYKGVPATQVHFILATDCPFYAKSTTDQALNTSIAQSKSTDELLSWLKANDFTITIKNEPMTREFPHLPLWHGYFSRKRPWFPDPDSPIFEYKVFSIVNRDNKIVFSEKIPVLFNFYDASKTQPDRIVKTCSPFQGKDLNAESTYLDFLR